MIFDYSGDAGEAYHARRKLPPEAERWIANVRAAKIQPYVPRTARVLEYGVGFGWNLMALKCSEKVGFDVLDTLQETVESHGIQYVNKIELLDSDSFDVVLCHHTLEHIRDPVTVLDQIRDLLKPGGTFLLFVPYERERKYQKYNPNDRSHHLYSWCPRSIGNLVSSRGFKVNSVRLQRFRFDRVAAVTASKLRLGQVGYRALRRAGLLLLPEYEIALVAKS